VAKLNAREAQFHESMRMLDVTSQLRPMGVGQVGSWDDSQSLARFHIAELRKFFPEFASEDFE
jgi:hypothetical protein